MNSNTDSLLKLMWLLYLAYHTYKEGLKGDVVDKSRLLLKWFIAFFWIDFLSPVASVFFSWIPGLGAILFLLFMIVDWYVISPRTDGDKAMYTVCSTLLRSFENIFKAVRRNLCFFVSRIILLISNYMAKRVSKYYTKEEMEELKERAENLSSTIAAAYRKYSPLSKEERDNLMSVYIPVQRSGEEGKSENPSKTEFRDVKFEMKKHRQGTLSNLTLGYGVHKGAPKMRVQRAPINP